MEGDYARAACSHSACCDFERDVQVFVLEKIHGPKSLRLRREEIWALKLNAFQPDGLNKRSSEYSSIHKSLHRLN